VCSAYRGKNLTRLSAAAEYPIDPDNVVIRTQAQADAADLFLLQTEVLL
jgi:hypothetical protein